MSEKRIVITSLLKPVNDTRLYEKLALSLNKLEGANVHIAAYQAPAPEQLPPGIFLHPIFSFKRLSLGRAAAQIKFFRFLLQVKPQLIIVSTHELLLVSYTYCKFHNCRMVYDIRENYALNLRTQHIYSGSIKQLLAFGVEQAEQLTAPAVSHFLVAERSYVQELPFLSNRFTVLENKYQPDKGYHTPATPVLLPQDTLKLLYTGTISEVYGIFEAVALADMLWQTKRNIHLTIIGYCARQETYHKLQLAIQNKPYITLIGGNRLVPHSQIIEQIRMADLGLLPYRPNESTFRCIPTKIYEYAAHALPFLIQANPYWQALVERYNAGLAIDFRAAEAEGLLLQLMQSSFYKNGIPEEVFWQQEEEKLLKAIAPLLK
ncbi:glycosyltransferase [Pontibacter sp. SGAir0037]|uniref:glycosyltransferase n=1 Tax=Pontibacter sp. SGAir0037 TaxID=2571030 RepID=UPI0010CD2E8B|nr:glycosyltransferase [Pontibacter sp. SGAir0037]QCR21659.1 glycosyltransferase [Pontibacter sp. SGAir0037]